jgi:DNA adenine methylase
VRYLGGKYRIAWHLREAMEPFLAAHRYEIWEPFCGGLNFSRTLANCSGLLSDSHPALISLYKAYRSGWTPPRAVTEDDHALAKTLPDSEPLKAFVGFGHSFGGMYFAKYDAGKPELLRPRNAPPVWIRHDRSAAATKSLAPLRTHLSRFDIAQIDFLKVTPARRSRLIYCDPPYLGTTGYGTTFDHDRFWTRCRQWARHTTVLVSEYQCPVPHELVWQKTRHRAMTRHAASDAAAPVEHLFRVLPRTQLTFDFGAAVTRAA